MIYIMVWNSRVDSYGNPLLSPGSAAPALTKNSKQILKNFKNSKKKKIWVVDNLMREVRSNFQIIYTSEQLFAKKTNLGSVKMYTVQALF